MHVRIYNILVCKTPFYLFFLVWLTPWSYEPLTLTQAGTGRDILGSRI
jgi:hypothetical protein